MTVKQLFLRCFIKKEGSQWVAVCVDINLAAQGDNSDEAKSKLESMIVSYVREAYEEDREYADQLLNRRAPLSIMAEYYFARMVTSTRLARLFESLKGNFSSFKELVPLTPA